MKWVYAPIISYTEGPKRTSVYPDYIVCVLVAVAVAVAVGVGGGVSREVGTNQPRARVVHHT